MTAVYTSGVMFILSFVKFGELVQTSNWGDPQAELRIQALPSDAERSC
jgi:hypothetical protein